MIITKLSLPRRTFLRGVGATVALPLLDAMVPAATALAKTAGAPTPRLAFWGTANGVFGPNFKPAGRRLNETGSTIVSRLTDHGSSPILAPLDAFRDQMVVATQLGNLAAESKQAGEFLLSERAGGEADGGRGHRAGGDAGPVCGGGAGEGDAAVVDGAGDGVELRGQLRPGV